MPVASLFATLLSLSPPVDACTIVYPPDLVAPLWGPVPTGAVVALRPDAELVPVSSESGDVVLDDAGLDGLYRLPDDLAPGMIRVDHYEVEVVAADEWEPGPPPQLDAVELEFGWRVDHPGCKTVGGSWALVHRLELSVTPTDDAGWFVQGVAGDEVLGRIGVGTTALEDDHTAWTYQDPEGSDRQRCLDIELVDAAGQVHDTVALPCQDAPRKPLLPACSASGGTPAGLSSLLALSMALGLRRRR